MRHVFRLALFFAAAFFPVWGQAACTQADLDGRLSPALQYRLRCLDGLGRLDVFRVAATPHARQISEARAGQADEAQAVAVICRETEALIVIADDVLTGGDGVSGVNRSPWQGATPDDVLAKRNAVMQRCKGQLACYRQAMAGYRQEIASLDARVRTGGLSAVAYIGQMHALFGRVLASMTAGP